MNMNLLKQYAELIVKTGANVQPGQKVRVQAEVDQALLAKEVTAYSPTKIFGPFRSYPSYIS